MTPCQVKNDDEIKIKKIKPEFTGGKNVSSKGSGDDLQEPAFIASARAYGSCARIYAPIFMKILVVNYYLMNLSFKFHKDPSFR